MHRVRETYKAQVEQDFITGRKHINQYEVINEIGRGVHGKVKLARSLETGDYVAIKIIQRFSKKRRLGRVTVAPEDKTKREIAILKKIRHPNVVGLLEVIDDPELKKIYMVLEHVELGEIVWRKKGLPSICLHERRRIEKETRGEADTGEDEKYFKMIQRRKKRKEEQRSTQFQQGHHEPWSLEHGDEPEDIADLLPLSRQPTSESLCSLARSHSSMLPSRPGSRAPSRAPSQAGSRCHTQLPNEFDCATVENEKEDEEFPRSLRSLPSLPSSHGSAAALEGTMYGSYPDDPSAFRGRSPSMADSIISHMSSVDENPIHDAFEDDFSYVPCFTIEKARSAFRDTVLGLEYLHYEGIVHRDIKPANLLWTKDHRVKISDFGVSYFGRPIREGDAEENVSEADAQDFDDDLELAKTVGTPAFFAPELCYTEVDVEQPKVTEQIDVWSLGITLYCLIYARIPFMAEDEYSLFKTIAKEDVYIPRRRLKPIDPSHSTSQVSLHRRMGPSSTSGPYREDGELAYEEIDDELYDLLRRMLVKDPTERIKLREVKRHPWVIHGFDNLIGWLDDSDPSRKAAGRRIQVDDRELERAVVPIKFLERARSAVKKAAGKVIGVVRSERGEGSRHRATSSAASSAPDIYTPYAHYSREARRASLRGDDFDYFETIRADEEHRYEHHHPLAQSLTASPDRAADREEDHFSRFAQTSVAPVGVTPHGTGSGTSSNPDARPEHPDRSISEAASTQTVIHRGHSHSRSVTHASIGRPFSDHDRSPCPLADHARTIFGGHLWSPKVSNIEETARARSTDYGLFESTNKHSEASLAVSHDSAPGLFEPPSVLKHPRPSRSVDLINNKLLDKPLPSPLFFQPYIVQQYQSSVSTPNMAEHALAASILDERPSTANRTPEVHALAPRKYGASTPESFQMAQESLARRRRIEVDADQKRNEFSTGHRGIELENGLDAAPEKCPPSPDDDIFVTKQAECKRAQSSSSISSANLASALASPSDVTSPLSSVNMGSQGQSFASVPSLPALVSSASSECADPEGDFLQQPGVVPAPTESVFSVESSPDTMTPPALSKEPSIELAATPEPDPKEMEDVVTVHKGLQEMYMYNVDPEAACAADDDDSDSDDGLTMARKKPKAKVPTARRGTNASVRSTETAKKVSMVE